MSNVKKIVLTGGGTAGHITPNLALVPYLSDYEIHYIGQPNSMEQELTSAYPQIIFHSLECVKFSRSMSLKNLTIPAKLFRAKRSARNLLAQISPSVIFSKGGFVALPVTMAAKNIPIILHESDFSLGLANKLAVKKCTYACCSFSSLADSLKNGVCTGAPLRQSLYEGSKAKAEAECGLKGRKNLLIFGGSLGAKAINEVIFESIGKLTKSYNVVHITGKNDDTDISAPNYYKMKFTSSIADYFAWADLVVSRGGANALFELAALKKPSLIVPLPKGNSRGDQIDNANYFASLGFFKVLEQSSLNAETLLSMLANLDRDRHDMVRAMQSATNIDGTKKIAELIILCAEGNF